MMHKIFIALLNMSINAGYLAIIVIILRLFFRNAPKNINCILWAMVGLRLVFPLSIESFLSLIPRANTVSVPSLQNNHEAITPPEAAADIPFSDYSTASPSDVTHTVITAAVVIWLIGMFAMLIYFLISSISLHKKVSISLALRDNIRLCDCIDSPFVLGIIKPQIYIPSDIDPEQLSYVVSHERSHIKRLDNLWKPLGFILLSVHWFNPLIWISYILFCRDIEIACDERTIKEMNLAEKQQYSEALLMCSTAVRPVSVHHLAFGEANVKERVKTVLNYKKPAAWLITIAVIFCIVIAVCFLTNPINTRLDDETEAYLHQVIIDYHTGDYLAPEDSFACEDHIILKAEKKGGVTTVYALVMYLNFTCEDGLISDVSGCHIPSVITLDMSGSAYSYQYWQSEDGTRYVPSIREKFPWYLENRAINIHKTASEQSERCITQAEKHFGVKYADPYENTTYTTRAYNAEE